MNCKNAPWALSRSDHLPFVAAEMQDKCNQMSGLRPEEKKGEIIGIMFQLSSDQISSDHICCPLHFLSVCLPLFSP